METLKDVITLRGKEIEVEVEYVDQSKLKFYTENPRVYSLVWKNDGTEPTQQEIQDALVKLEHVRETLVPSIKLNGGLIEPLLVKDNVVLEGNSRLAAYRLLVQVDPKKWERVRIRRLPESIRESQIFSLLGEYHIIGKKDWQPYEQAGYLYRQHKKHGLTVEELQKQVGLGKAKITHLIDVYQYMIDIDDRSPSQWSYYDELLKGRRFDKVVEKYPDFRDVIVEKIQSGEIERAVDIRDKLPLITKIGGNTLKKFVAGSLSFEVAVHDAKLRGAGDHIYKRLNEFRQWLADGQLEEEVESALEHQKQTFRFEIDRIERLLRALAKKIEPKQRA
jgi:hypothetical protein